MSTSVHDAETGLRLRVFEGGTVKVYGGGPRWGPLTVVDGRPTRVRFDALISINGCGCRHGLPPRGEFGSIAGFMGGVTLHCEETPEEIERLATLQGEE